MSNAENAFGNIDDRVWDDLLRRSIEEYEEEQDFLRKPDDKEKRYTEKDLWERYSKGYINGLRIGRFEAQHPDLFDDE